MAEVKKAMISPSILAADFAKLGEEIEYTFDKSQVGSVHVVFSSDLNRDTLPGSPCERMHATRANVRLDSPQMYMPKTLCREYYIYGELEGKREQLAHVTENRCRYLHTVTNKVFDKLILKPVASWGDGDTVPVFSFDFE